LIDDLLPCFSSSKSPYGFKSAFSQSKGGKEMWVMLLEKAWSKVNGSYENTITGLPSDALKCLTGAPVEFYNHEYFGDELWDIIKDSDRLNYIISGSSATDESTQSFEGKQGTKDMQGVGLVSDHAYSIISAFEFEH
jgi:calpain-15